MLDLTVICMGDRLLTQEFTNPRLTPPPELRSAEDDMGRIICQAHVLRFHLTQETRVCNVNDDVGRILCGALPASTPRRPGVVAQVEIESKV